MKKRITNKDRILISNVIIHSFVFITTYVVWIVNAFMLGMIAGIILMIVSNLYLKKDILDKVELDKGLETK